MNFNNNQPNINETFIIEPDFQTGSTPIVSACTAFYTDIIISCSGDSIVNLGTGEVTVNVDLNPAVDSGSDLGTSVKRFRQINTVSGSSTYWASTTANIGTLNVNTIDLGLDSDGDHRILTADSSILVKDTLAPGNY